MQSVDGKISADLFVMKKGWFSVRIHYAVEIQICTSAEATSCKWKSIRENYIHLLKNLSQSTSSEAHFLVSRDLGTGAISKMLQTEMRPRSAAQPREDNVLKRCCTPWQLPCAPRSNRDQAELTSQRRAVSGLKIAEKQENRRWTSSLSYQLQSRYSHWPLILCLWISTYLLHEGTKFGEEGLSKSRAQ